MRRFALVPLFYLHVSDGNGFSEDEEGLDLPDQAAAREVAIRGARDMMAAEVQRGELDLGSFIEVEDENHQLLITVTFAEAIALRATSVVSESGGRSRTDR